MALASYADLIATVPQVMAREGDAPLIAYLPAAVAVLEGRLNRTLRVGSMEASATSTSVGGQLTLPSDYLVSRRIVAAPYGALSLVTPEWASDTYPLGGDGTPAFYTIQGSTLTLYPSYDGSIGINYYAALPPLETNGTNWLMAYHPDIYLFGTLIEAYTFLQSQELASMWNERFQGAVAELQALDRADRYRGAVARVKGPTP